MPPPQAKPDGSLLAFNSYSESGLGQAGNVFTVRPDGSELTQITEYEGPGGTGAFGQSWSPDGTQIAFGLVRPNGNGDVHIMNPDGTGLIQVTDRRWNEHNSDWGTHP